MKIKKNKPLFRGLAATTAALLALSTVSYTVAKSSIAVGWMDGWTGTDRNIYKDWEEEVPGYTIPGASEGFTYLKGKDYKTKHATVQEYAQALKAHAVRQGEEGFALLKNDNEALPLKNSAAGKNIALFGWNAYNLPTGHTGVVAGNITGDVVGWGGKVTHKESYINQISLYDAFSSMSGVNVNETVQADQFPGKMAAPSRGGGWGGGASTPWEDFQYTIPEVAPSSDVVSTWNIDKATTTGIVVLGRGGGEGNNYKVDAATNADDPLALSPDELQMVKTAKEKCAKVVVLIVSANAMELGPLVEKGGAYEVDSIGFCGIPNDYQYEGIANVLYGKVNATGGLTDTYVYDNSFTPASINMGQQFYSDTDSIMNFEDPLGRNVTSLAKYYADHYVVEAEGIYVGYKYYETRYYDAMANAEATKATSKVGSTKVGQAWDYQNEVVFPFGQSLSYIPYTQKLVDVKVNNSETGKVTAKVEITNNGKEDGTFLAQLYVSRPYTQYDKDNKVEKSAVDFLNSAKVAVKAGKTETVEITLPTRYLASWDSNALGGAGTYIMDEGDYLFTAASGAHEAVNNVLSAQGHKTDETTTIGETVVWNLENFDDKTYSVSNGVEVRNQMENADINYFLGEGTVTYLSRSDWEGTFPKNYTDCVTDAGIPCEDPFTIKGSAKEKEWLTELITAQYKVTPVSDSSKWPKVEGTKPAGLKDGQTVWQWIMDVAQTDPEAFSDIHSAQWQAVAAAIDLDEAFVCVAQSGGSSRTFPSIGNPISKQSESVAGYSQNLTIEDGKTMTLNVASNTLLGSSFNPELAYEWGEIEGEGGLWLQKTTGQPAITVWGGGLNQHRHAYNGRNSEYMSEDPMLTNRIGEAQYRALQTTGSICGPKHMGFNDQELNRQGNACYMTEQKVRETDTRCYEGAMRVEEGNATGAMMSFARIGATNVTNSMGYIMNIIREEWGFTGIITTDMGMGAGYHELTGLNMVSVNEYAGFGSAAEYSLGEITEESIMDKTKAPHIKFSDACKDPVFAEACRQTSLYILYTLAHSGSGLYVERVENMGEDIVVPPTTIQHHDPVGTLTVAPWEYGFIALEVVFGILTGVAGLAWIASSVMKDKEEN